MKYKFIGSTIALVIGISSLFGSIAQISSGKADAQLNLLVGVFVILGSLAYRSLKKRRLGLVKSTNLRQILEIIALVLIIALAVLQTDLKMRLATSTVCFIIPLWSLIAYGIIFFKKSSSEYVSEQHKLMQDAARTELLKQPYDSSWKIALPSVCAAILAYGIFYSKNTSNDPLHLIAYKLPLTLIIWGIFCAVVTKRYKDKVAAYSFLAIFLSMVVSSLIGFSQQKKETIQAITKIQDHYSAIIDSSVNSQGIPKRIEPIDTTSKARGEVDEMAKFIKEVINQQISLRNDYISEIDAIGWDSILDAERILADKPFIESKELIQQTKTIVGKYQEKANILHDNIKENIHTLDISESSKRKMLKSYELRREKTKKQEAVLWDLEKKAVTEVENIINLLSVNKDAWTVEEGQFVFNNDSDVSRFNSYYDSIQSIVNQQTKIQNQIAEETNQYLNNAKEMLTGSPANDNNQLKTDIVQPKDKTGTIQAKNKDLHPDKLSTKEIYDKNNESVVLIRVYDENGNMVTFGSGVCIHPNGVIITNFHILNSDSFYFDIKFQKHGVFEDTYIAGISPILEDYIVLRVDAKDLPSVDISTRNEYEIGEKIITIGNPQGLLNSLSEGVVSGRRFYGDHEYYQMTAPISQGSSGGAVFDEHGYLVGISTAILEEGQNLNFFIPIYRINDNAEIFDTFLAIKQFNSLCKSRAKEYKEIGDQHFKSKDYEEAIKNYDISLKYDYGYADAYFVNGTAKYKDGSTEEGLADLFMASIFYCSNGQKNEMQKVKLLVEALSPNPEIVNFFDPQYIEELIIKYYGNNWKTNQLTSEDELIQDLLPFNKSLKDQKGGTEKDILSTPQQEIKSNFTKKEVSQKLGSFFSGMNVSEKTNGVKIIEIAKGSLGFNAGLRTGDIVTEIDGKNINSLEDYVRISKELNKTNKLKLSLIVLREGMRYEAIIKRYNN